jgi:hypothetical protein
MLEYISYNKISAEYWWLIGYKEVINKFKFWFNIYSRIYLFLKMITYIIFILFFKILWKNKEYFHGWIWAYIEWIKILKRPVIK